MEREFIDAVRRGNDAVVFDMGPDMDSRVIEKALDIAIMKNENPKTQGEYQAIVDFLQGLL